MSTKSAKAWRKPIAVEQDSSTPRYSQLKEIIREQYASWEAGQPIPSELELCQMYSVSRTTVRKALDHLTQEGLLYRLQGKGTFISPPKLRERFLQQVAGIYDDMASRGRTFPTRFPQQSLVPPTQLAPPD